MKMAKVAPQANDAHPKPCHPIEASGRPPRTNDGDHARYHKQQAELIDHSGGQRVLVPQQPMGRSGEGGRSAERDRETYDGGENPCLTHVPGDKRRCWCQRCSATSSIVPRRDGRR